MHHRHRNYSSGRAITAIVLGLSAGIFVLLTARSLTRNRPILQPEDAPRHAWRRRAWASRSGAALVGRTVTINRPREEIYARWRDFSRFPNFMENVRSVTPLDRTRSRWEVDGPGGSTIEFETRITEERPNEAIAWETDEGAQVHSKGHVVFRDAPGGRGTQVEATISYEPPAGAIGQLAATIFQREPHIQVRRELRRFKQIMETGEIATAVAGPAAPRA